jgi:hypothetical protein
MNQKLRISTGCAALAATLAAAAWAALPAAPKKDYPLRPVPFTAVRVADAFWAPRMETNRVQTVWYDFRKCEETGRIDNFAKAAGLMKGPFRGIPFDDSDVYKVIEGAAYTLAVHPDPKLDAYLDALIAKIAAAQEPDGYLYTARRLFPPEKMPGMSGPKRWSNLGGSHELYNAGHLYEAAVAHFQATGKRSLLDVAVKHADLVAREFGPGKVQYPPGHEEIEIGLVKLYRATGEAKYFDLAKYFVDLRGRPETHRLYGAYAQDHKPIAEQDEAVGHAVRAGYFYAGVADVAALSGDNMLPSPSGRGAGGEDGATHGAAPAHPNPLPKGEETLGPHPNPLPKGEGTLGPHPNPLPKGEGTGYGPALDRLWQNVVGKKLHLTGGIGATAGGEAFGANYDLPNASAYLETCAAIANALWNHRMFLRSGDAKYLDVLERTIYNGFLSGISLSGDRFFYNNPLESNGKYERSPWFGCSCCPVNIVRFVPEISSFIYATRGRELLVNLYIGGTATVELAGTPVGIRQVTRYPWDGRVEIVIGPPLPTRAPCEAWSRSVPGEGRGEGVKQEARGSAARPLTPGYPPAGASPGGRRESSEFTLCLRIPGWARNQPVPSDLYRYDDGLAPAVKLTVAGQVVPVQPAMLDKGFVRITRAWKAGDRVLLELEMPVRRVVAHAAVAADRDRFALERGPLVYCAEGADNGGRVLDKVFAGKPRLEVLPPGDLLGGIVPLRMSSAAGASLVCIPYYAWCHRGPNEMRVWFPTHGR